VRMLPNLDSRQTSIALYMLCRRLIHGCHCERSAAISLPVISTIGLPTAGRSGEICSRMEVNYRPQPDVSTGLDMTRKGCHSAHLPSQVHACPRESGGGIHTRDMLHEIRICHRAHREHRDRTEDSPQDALRQKRNKKGNQRDTRYKSVSYALFGIFIAFLLVSVYFVP